MKKLIFLLMFLGVMFFASDTTMAQDCRPGANQIAVYEGSNYTGRCRILNVGEYRNPRSMGFRNDSISSVAVGRNVRAVLCQHDDFRGNCSTFNSSDSYLGNNRVGNNQVSSIRVVRRGTTSGRCRPSSYQIAIFEHSNYTGRCRVLGVGSYSSSRSFGLPNDSISSVIIGRNVYAQLYEHSNYRGKSQLFRSADPNLGNNSIGNDRVSSIRVTRRTSTPPPTGVNGRNVRYVAYNGGYFNYLGSQRWAEYKRGGNRAHATFVETGRDEWSVYLRKTDGARLQLDLYTKRVKISGRNLFTITRTSSRSVGTPSTIVNGRNVRYVSYRGGYFRYIGNKRWAEYKSGKRTRHATFVETSRSQSSVYLRKSDGARLQLNISSRRINLNGRRLYTITSARAR